MRKAIFLAVSLIVVIVVTNIIYASLVKNSYVKLASAQPLAGTVAQALDTTGGSINLPVAGKDFSLSSLNYFDNNDWAIANIVPTKNSSVTAGIVILEKQGGVYKIALGPGTAFDSSVLINLPSAVGQYLSKNGYIYGYVYK